MKTAYDGIYIDLKSSIVRGTYAYKDFLPSESALVKRYGCAHNTVRKAISALASEGYVQPIHGKGVRVLYRSTPLISSLWSVFEPTHVEPYRSFGELAGHDLRTEVLLVEPMVAGEEFCAKAGFEVGAELVHFERVRHCDGRRLVYEQNYFRKDVVEGITKEDAAKSIYRYMQDACNCRIVTTKRVVTVQHSDDRDRELLDVEGVDYLPVIYVVAYDGEGLQCEFTISHHHPDGFSLAQTSIRTRVNA